jgi:hypothetical protein
MALNRRRRRLRLKVKRKIPQHLSHIEFGRVRQLRIRPPPEAASRGDPAAGGRS